jgi:hypothetical protein
MTPDCYIYFMTRSKKRSKYVAWEIMFPSAYAFAFSRSGIHLNYEYKVGVL